MSRHPVPTDILIVSAHLPELSGFAAILGRALAARVGGLEVVAAAVGIGLPHAAAGTAFELGRHTPRAVILVGTAGAYRGRGLSIGQVVVGSRLHLVSAAVASRAGAFPAPMSVVADADPGLGAALAGEAFREACVATTLAITTDDGVAATVSGSVDADVEHLEAFGVAAACGRHGARYGVVLGVANIVGSTARQEWLLHHEAAGNAAAVLVTEWLTSGAPGLRT